MKCATVLVTFGHLLDPEQRHCSLPTLPSYLPDLQGPILPCLMGLNPFWASALPKLCCSRCRVLFTQSPVEGHLKTVGGGGWMLGAEARECRPGLELPVRNL